MSLACPCCGYRTFEGAFYGSYELCPVCGWEDDAVQLANPCSDGGANKESLFQCQRARASWSKEKTVGFERDPMWRPLIESETAFFSSIAKEEHWRFKGHTEPELAYWRRPIQPPQTTTGSSAPSRGEPTGSGLGVWG